MRVLVILAGVVVALATTTLGASSPWAAVGPDGRLNYQTTDRGDRILDFSWAGYEGGGVALPEVPVKAGIESTGGPDDTAAIQALIDSVARLELTNGFRGAAWLKAGVYHCRGPLAIKASGVVLRGAGSGSNETVILMEGAPHVAITMGGAESVAPRGSETRIIDSYVPSGATTFHVRSSTGFQAGDTLLIHRPVTPEWVHFMGMDGLVRSGKKETWLGAPGSLTAERALRAVSGDLLTLEVPLADSLDAAYLGEGGASVVKGSVTGGIFHVGVEHLRIISPPQPVPISEKHHQALRLNGVADGWVRGLVVVDTVNSVAVGARARRVTVQQVHVEHTVPTQGSAKPADFAADGCQVLFDRCSVRGDNLFYFATGGRVTGPNVLLNCEFHGNGHLQPHMRWATGLLTDNCRVPEGGLDFMNRGEMGSGHGWAMGWAVAWNCTARSMLIQQPPGVMNWAIGCSGTRERAGMPFGHQPILPEGVFDSHGTRVTPGSLYLAQLAERLGSRAVKNIGYESGLP